MNITESTNTNIFKEDLHWEPRLGVLVEFKDGVTDGAWYNYA